MSRATKFLERWRLARRGYSSVRPEELWRSLIERHVPGRTFADIGCMWMVNGDYSFFAASKGASGVTGIDVNAATETFERRNRELGNPVRFVQGDLNDPAISDWAGTFDVVFCSGVLYHVPNPVYSLIQLRRICRETLILTTATMMDAPNLPNAAVLLAGLDDEERAKLAYPTKYAKRGLDSEYRLDRGYANWVWLPTPGCVRAMLVLAGFRVDEFHPSRRVTTVVASPGDVPTWGPTQ